MNLLIARAVDAVESGLLSADPETLGFAAKVAASNQIPDTDEDGRPIYPEMKTEIEEGVHKLETLLATNVDRNFDKFEIFALRNIFAVEDSLVPWVRLRHYEGVDLSQANQQPTHTPESTLLLRRKLQETRKLHQALATERAKNEAVLSQLRALVLPPTTTTKAEPSSSPLAEGQTTGEERKQPNFSFLTSTPAAQNLGMRPISPEAHPSQAQQSQASSLAINTSFALSQLPSLRALLAELRPKLQSLPTVDANAGQGRFARERGEYVETQTMRILERRGVDLEDRDGAGQRMEEGAGTERRRIGREEVEALEKIVGAVGGDHDSGEHEGDEDAMEE